MIIPKMAVILNRFIAVALVLLLPLGATAQGFPQYWVGNSFMGLRIDQDTVVSFVSQCEMYASQISPNSCDGEAISVFVVDSNTYFYAGSTEIFDQGGQRPLNSVMQFNEPDDGVSECNGTIMLSVPRHDSMMFWIVNQTSSMNASLGMVTNGNFGLKYSVVNVKANGGNGEIVDGKKEIYLLREQTTERVMAIQHANGQDWWIMVNDHDSGEFSVFLTIGDSIVFSHNYSHPELRYERGGGLRGVGEYDYHAPSQTLIFSAMDQGIYICRFDPCDGQITYLLNPWVRMPQYKAAYGLALSNNGRFVYLTTSNKDLYQVDLTQVGDTLEPITLLNSDTLPPGIQSQVLGLERAPDGKIYFARSGSCPYPLNFSGAIGRIANPDLPYPACDVQADLYALPQWRLFGALPNMPKYVPYAGIQAGTITASAQSGCPGTTVAFSHNSCGQLGQAWDFGDGSPLDSSAVASHTYLLPGDHTVRLYLWHGNDRDTVTLSAVSIANCIQADFQVDVASGCVPLEVQFASSLTGHVDHVAWDFGDGSAESPLLAPGHLYAAPGSYTVTLRAWNATYADTVRQTSVVRVEDCGHYFTVSPNPSAGQLHVRYWQPGTERIHAEVIDLLGRKVARQTFAGGYGDHRWDLSELADAMYVLRVTRGSAEVLDLKLVIQK
jgi:PKD domain/Secretion system C-terminal sorting domain